MAMKLEDVVAKLKKSHRPILRKAGITAAFSLLPVLWKFTVY